MRIADAQNSAIEVAVIAPLATAPADRPIVGRSELARSLERPIVFKFELQPWTVHRTVGAQNGSERECGTEQAEEEAQAGA